jgi:hypothetical protein
MFAKLTTGIFRDTYADEIRIKALVKISQVTMKVPKRADTQGHPRLR